MPLALLGCGTVAACMWFLAHLLTGFGPNPNALYTFNGFWPDGQIAVPPYYNNCVLGQTNDHRCVIIPQDHINLTFQQCQAQVQYSNSLPMLGAAGNAYCQIQG